MSEVPPNLMERVLLQLIHFSLAKGSWALAGLGLCINQLVPIRDRAEE